MSRRNRSRRFASGAALEAPWQLSNKGIWLRSDLGIQTAATKVTQWSDQFPGAHHLTQAAGVNEGVYTPAPSGGLRNRPYITWTGAVNYAIAATYSQTTDATIWLVYDSTAVLGDGTRLWLDRGGLGQELYVGVAADGRTPSILWSGANRLTYASAVTTPHVLRLRMSVSGTLGMRVDAGAEQTNAAGQVQLSNWATMGHTSAAPLMRIYEVIGIQSIATAAEDAMMQSYFSATTGLF